MSAIINVLKRKSASGNVFCQAEVGGLIGKPTKNLCSFQFENGMVHIQSITNARHKKSMTEAEFNISIFNGSTIILSALEASDISVESRVRLVVQNRPVREGDYALAPNGLVAKMGVIEMGYPEVKKYQKAYSDYQASEWKPVKFIVTDTGEPQIEAKYFYDIVRKRVVNLDPVEDLDWFKRNKENIERISVLSNEFPMELKKEITSGNIKDGDIINY
jgi:hypothetical protein